MGEEGAQKNERESKTRRRAYRKARREGEQLKRAWVSPKGMSAEQLENQRIEIKGRGKGTVDELDARGKHKITFDDGAKLTSNLGESGFTVLSHEVIAEYVNECMTEREGKLFEQRMQHKLEAAAKNAAKKAGQKKKKKYKTVTDEEGNEIEVTDSDDEEEPGDDDDDDLMELEGEFDFVVPPPTCYRSRSAD